MPDPTRDESLRDSLLRCADPVIRRIDSRYADELSAPDTRGDPPSFASAMLGVALFVSAHPDTLPELGPLLLLHSAGIEAGQKESMIS